MSKKVLVTYATKHGATAEIAARIGEVLGQSGLMVDVLPVKQVQDLTPYPAVILGSAVYIGQWRKEAAQFLEDYETELAEKDIWLFSSGPTGEGEPEDLLQGWDFPEGLQPIADRINPHEIVVFHGELDTDKLNFLEKFAVKNIKAPTGDFRDWEDITAWAEGIAKTLLQTVP